MQGRSHNGTVPLELRRRHLSQRLNELRIRLDHIRQCRQHDSQSKDRRGCGETDSSTTQQGQREHYPDVDGRGPSDGLRLDSIPASQSPRQKTVNNLGNYKPEVESSDQQRDTVQDNNPDCQIAENQPLSNVPSQQDQKR